MRIGQGYDVHRLVEGRKLIIGGVDIPYEKGLLGHSDADVLLHAVMDALLGAAALGDIGQHFPDSDERYKGISSIALLKEVGKILQENGYMIENIDSTVIAPEAEAFAVPPADGGKYRGGVRNRKRTGKRESDDGRRAWIYRYRRGDLRSGDRPFKFGGGLRAGGPRWNYFRWMRGLSGL